MWKSPLINCTVGVVVKSHSIFRLAISTYVSIFWTSLKFLRYALLDSHKILSQNILDTTENNGNAANLKQYCSLYKGEAFTWNNGQGKIVLGAVNHAVSNDHLSTAKERSYNISKIYSTALIHEWSINIIMCASNFLLIVFLICITYSCQCSKTSQSFFTVTHAV